MCTRTRIFQICPCKKPTCVDHGIICDGNGHIIGVDITSRTVWDYCNWWIVYGPPDLVLNSFITPQCKNLGWEDLRATALELCEKYFNGFEIKKGLQSDLDIFMIDRCHITMANPVQDPSWTFPDDVKRTRAMTRGTQSRMNKAKADGS
ncbi:hypothetical protein Trco_004809 [Trichoderma cornu-damae]|uniref:Uncharacterized protein n=1 Tax=Trichoderma cornu-damae TaxID=654480 RepID=A0A9P8QI69_9HYPO|nr:hypothetical protein Trco_004809 [Trichoderma cornu-damae]